MKRQQYRDQTKIIKALLKYLLIVYLILAMPIILLACFVPPYITIWIITPVFLASILVTFYYWTPYFVNKFDTILKRQERKRMR